MTMSAENVARAQEMREQGMYYQDIADALSVSYGAIQYNLTSGAKDKKATYHASHSDEMRLYNAAYVASHKKEAAVYRERNIERLTQYSRDYHRSHRDEEKAYEQSAKEKIAARKAAYYARNKRRINAVGKAYRESHLPENAAKSAARRAFILGVTIGNLSEIKSIYKRAKEDSNIRCYLCGEMIPLGERHVDHVRALTNGGEHRPSNLAISCASCNLSKGGKTLEEVGLLL